MQAVGGYKGRRTVKKIPERPASIGDFSDIHFTTAQTYLYKADSICPFEQ